MSDVATAHPILETMGRAAADVERALEAVLPRADGRERRVIEAMRYATLGAGKRFRPFLVLCGAALCGAPRDRALRAGAAIELVHSYSLIHDDLPAMDDDDLRRGRPSCHVAFDEATAILAGDALLTLAFEVLADEATHPDPSVRVALAGALARAAGARGMVGGQVIDLEAEHAADVDAATITELERKKTGALIAVSCEAGAILAGADAATRTALVDYGYALGLAFQVTDDLLDVEGNQTDLGKAVGKDAAAGKATFVSILGLDGAKSEARRLAESAIACLVGFGPAADDLRALARYVVDRKA